MARLVKSATLTGLRLKQPQRLKNIEIATEHVREFFGCKKGSGDFKAHLWLPEHERPILSVYEEAYQVHKRLTTPWEHGMDLIAKKGKPNLDAQHRKFTDRFYDAVGKQCLIYDSEIIPAAREFHGQKIFDQIGYPTADEWKAGWQLRVVTRPVPNVDDLRTLLPEEDLDQVRAEIREKTEEASKELLRRVASFARESANALSRYKKVKNSRLKEATVQERLREIISAADGLILPDADGNRNKELDGILDEISDAVLSNNFEDFKKDSELREETVSKLRQVDDKLRGYV